MNFLGLVFNDTDVWYMRKHVNFTPLIQWKRGARHATRADCLGEVRNHRTIYGNWRGSRAVRQFKLRFTGLYIAGQYESYDIHDAENLKP